MLTEIPADRLLQTNVYQDPQVNRICSRETNIAIMLIYRIVWDLLMLQSEFLYQLCKFRLQQFMNQSFFILLQIYD